MNWNNVDLKSSEVELNLLENYTFSTLLLEVNCNVREINRETVKAQAMESINAKYREAIEILNANLDNLTKFAQDERNKP